MLVLSRKQGQRIRIGDSIELLVHIVFCGRKCYGIYSTPVLKRNFAMSTQIEKEYQHIGKTHGCENHDHDVIHELSRRLDGVWRYDQYIANAEGQAQLQDFWRNVKAQELKNIEQLKKLLADHVQNNCF